MSDRPVIRGQNNKRDINKRNINERNINEKNICKRTFKREGTEKIMCGRYYVDEETAKEIRRLVLKLDQRFQEKADQNIAREMNRNMAREAERKMDAGAVYGTADGTAAVFPSQKATVIMGRERHLEAEQMLWGFPRFDGRGLLINARAETATERRTFRESVLHTTPVLLEREAEYEQMSLF